MGGLDHTALNTIKASTFTKCFKQITSKESKAIEHQDKQKKQLSPKQPQKLHRVFFCNSQLAYWRVINYRVLVICNDPSFCSLWLRLLNRSLEYCLDAFLQSVPAFIIAANSS
jgi:hypothetical protein